jgi:hypothetical protein
MSGFSWSLLNPYLSDGEVVDKWCEETGERFIMKADMQIVTGHSAEVKNRTVVLTEENWIELKVLQAVEPAMLPSPASAAVVDITPSRQKKHKPLVEIHSVEKEPVVPGSPFPHAFRICFFSGSASSIAKAGFGKMKRFLQVSSSFDDFLKSKVVRCHSALECEQVSPCHGRTGGRTLVALAAARARLGCSCTDASCAAPLS